MMEQLHASEIVASGRVRLWCRSALLLLGLCCGSATFAFVPQLEKNMVTTMSNVGLSEALQALTKATGCKIIFNHQDVAPYNVSIDFTGKSVESALNTLLADKPLSYQKNGDYVVISYKPETAQRTTTQVAKMIDITGEVVDARGEGLPGVAVLLSGTAIGVATDIDGKFVIRIPHQDVVKLQFSFIGMKPLVVEYKGKPMKVVLQEDDTQLEEVVITGIFERKTESFTGSAATFKAKDLKMVGKQNILQSLKSLDPAFKIMESSEFGSDPNRMPDIEIRGKSSVVGLKSEYGSDPNQPLFILDGFETDIQTIMNLNMERVASITLLKDAASTAIYGSKAANGVVVVETVTPEPGQLRVSYSGDFQITFPDLTQYNLMNAAEKLEFERLAGVYVATAGNVELQHDLTQVYNDRLARVKGGVDTYWLSEPVRTGFIHKHNLFLEGGDDAMRYGAGISYAGTQGVMNNSDREVLGVNFDLLYRKGKFRFSNKVHFDYTKTNDPFVSFSEYALANPYYEKNRGKDNPYLEREVQGNTAYANIFNPLWNDEQNNMNKKTYITVSDNLQLQYDVLTSLQLRARFGVSLQKSDFESFASPFNKEYLKISDPEKKGSYSKNNEQSFTYSGEVTATYGTVIGDVHRINAVAGANLQDNQIKREGYSVIGFQDDKYMNPSHGNSYPESSKPAYSNQIKRSVSSYLNVGYSFDERYLLDANIRVDGASMFGSNKRYTPTWSVGTSWNIHNERFIKNIGKISMMKLRASIGNPGNQNFSDYRSFNTYRINTTYASQFGYGAMLSAYGNPDLDWQKTLDLNVGFDFGAMRNRLKFSIDAYRKETDPLIVIASLASSTGQKTHATNLGSQITKGVSGTINYSPIYKLEENITWQLSLNARHQTSEYAKIGSSLESMNTEMRGSSLSRYYDGGSPTDLWAVRSLGIDPMTGQEVYLTKEGERTFKHNYRDEVIVGNSEPKVDGVIGTTVYIKGFSFSAYLRYKIGADKFNSALYEKVENITKDNWTRNLDKRALYGRWQKPGDVAQFKGIGIVDGVDPMSSRFVQRENSLQGESFSVGYEFMGAPWLEKVGLQNLVLRAYMNDIFYWSTIKAERGTEYPFARSTSFSVNLIF
ncbi:MAG: SusC/RagA family TonB-linked outer membrane protein [Marinifilaceae bacterium]